MRPCIDYCGGNLEFVTHGEYNLDLTFDAIKDLRQSSEKFTDCVDLPMSTDLLKLFETFKKEDMGPMCQLWVEFLDMVQLLLVFIRACRTSNWDLHLYCFRQMLAYFFAYDNINYA